MATDEEDAVLPPPPPPTRANHSKRLLSLPPPPKPMSSMSTQIKERTRKLSRVFSSRHTATARDNAPPPPRTPLHARRSHPSLLLSTSPGSSRSEDLLRDAHSTASSPLNPSPVPLTRVTTAPANHVAPKAANAGPSTIGGASSRDRSHTAASARRKRSTNPDDCIIS
ncbi:hypothetical protein BC940DRAFT_170450 [Gongronella butleri]|nr:hypothetical protein BC940DRAFT_170450 [Gongronella butleri]